MAQVSSFLSTNNLSGVGSIAEFTQGTRTFVPMFNVCPVATAFDQFGRAGGYGSLNVLNAPGCYSPSETIENENSLRPVLSSNPLYKNIQSGVGGNGASTLFGQSLPGLAWQQKRDYPITVSNAAACQVSPNQVKYWQYPSSYTNPNAKCDPDGNLNGIGAFVGGGKQSDLFRYPMYFPLENQKK